MMTVKAPRRHGDAVGHFGGEGVLRPPVPGEENVKSDAVRPESYEPEGRASPDHACPSWAESLNALLDDRDGIALFRDFLAQEGRTDVIDFWLACSGFGLAYCAPPSCSSTSMEMLEKRRLKLAKAIYRKYIISDGLVMKKIKPVTKSRIYERVRHLQLDSTLFEQAKHEVQEAMEAEAYPIFLKSNIFLMYAQEICTEQEIHKWELNSHNQETGSDKKEPINPQEEPNSKQEVNRLMLETGNDTQELNSLIQEPGSGKKEHKQKMDKSKQEVTRFLPKPVEKREWVESEIASANHNTPEQREPVCKLKHRVIQGCVRADAHKMSLLHKPCLHRMLKDVHTEPHKFAADLISRLELIQMERENWREVEEHLHPICTQQRDDETVSTVSSLCPVHLIPGHHGSSHSTIQWYDTHAENPEIILGEDAQSVIKTPSWSYATIHTHPHTCPKNSDTWVHGVIAGANQSGELGYSSREKCVCESMTVAYYFCGEPIPYRTTVKGRGVTLAHFRELLTKKGAYRFFFKKASNEFDCGVVYEEVCDDDTALPVFEGRIIGKVETIN